jgi:GT2 family glycosyltransferase
VEVAICIPTCERPEALQRLLCTLPALRFRGPPPRLRVIVVDNAGGSSRSRVESLRDCIPWRLDFEVEARRGIPFARNAALRLAARSDFAVFIDDDEVPEPDWLDRLLAVREKFGADAVTGPVLPRFEAPAPEWALRGGFFDSEHHPTGTRVAVAYTGNLLIRTACLAVLEPWFDERYAGVGFGEDADLTRRLHRAGGVIVWAEEAVVHEWIPAARVRAAWIAERALRKGIARTQVRRRLRPGPATTAHAIANGAARIARGGAALALFALGPPHRRVEALRLAASGIGGWLGLAGDARLARLANGRRP